MKQTKAIADLRQLCCLGLDKEIVIPAFLRALCTALPSSNNAFTGVDARLNPVYHMMDDPVDEFNPDLCADFITPERSSRAAAWFKLHPILPDFKILDDAFYRSDLYNLFYRPANIHYHLHVPVSRLGKPIGMLTVCRPRNHKPFNVREQKLVTFLLPYVTHALSVSNNNALQYNGQGQSSMMVMNTQGDIVYLADNAEHLLALATCPPIHKSFYNQKQTVLHLLKQLCQNLNGIFQGNNAAPPSCSYTNGYGRFTFNACWLNPYENEPGHLIGITIYHQEPVLLKALRAMQTSPLSPVQKEVALLITQGLSNEKIGEKLHIKLTTVKDHVTKLFIKLDIHRREELLPTLLALEKQRRIQK